VTVGVKVWVRVKYGGQMFGGANIRDKRPTFIGSTVTTDHSSHIHCGPFVHV